MARLERFLEPPRLRTLEADWERRATWLELFLDLVFVAAIAEVALTLGDDPTAAGFGRYLALFVPIGWAWAGFTFYATRFDTDDLVYRLLSLLAMFGVAGLASAVADALHGGQNRFVLAPDPSRAHPGTIRAARDHRPRGGGDRRRARHGHRQLDGRLERGRLRRLPGRRRDLVALLRLLRRLADHQQRAQRDDVRVRPLFRDRRHRCPQRRMSSRRS
jgi:hypothetical protein